MSEADAPALRGWQQPGFKIRATGVAIDRGRLLVHTVGTAPDWWALPGGGPEFQELSSETLAREMVEELGVTARVGRLLFVVERIFTTLNGIEAHHLDLSFEMSLDDEVRRRTEPWLGPSPEDYGSLLFHWHPLDTLGEAVPFYPAFMIEHLRGPLPQHPLHVAVRDG